MIGSNPSVASFGWDHSASGQRSANCSMHFVLIKYKHKHERARGEEFQISFRSLTQSALLLRYHERSCWFPSCLRHSHAVS